MSVTGIFKERQIAPRMPRIVMPLKVKQVNAAKVAQRERTGLFEGGAFDIDKTARKRAMHVNRIANIWRRLAKTITRREEKKEMGTATPTPKHFKETTPRTIESPYRSCNNRFPHRYVIPMSAVTFLPGEEPGVEQFGPSGKGRFFTAKVYFERLEAQGSKRARQVRKQVEADWGSRAKLTRRWTKILRKRRGMRMRKISRARTWGSEISWTRRRDNIVLLKV